MQPPISPSDPTPDGAPAWEQIDAYFAGELDAAATEQVRRYFARHPEVERTFRRPDAFVPAAHVSERGRDVDLGAAWRAMESRIAADHAANRAARDGVAAGRVRRMPAWRAVSTVAVLSVLAIVVGVWSWRGYGRGATGPLVATAYHTKAGQRATATLADGSSVLLGPASQLRVQSAGRDIRDVVLDGEAFFSVHGQPNTPFIVHAGDGIVRVLGTEFSVRRYAEDSSVRVVVSTGRVGLRARTDSDGVGVVLGASDAAQLGPRNRVVVMRGVDLAEYLSWRTGQLRFRNVPVSSVLAELGREYDLEINVRDSAIARSDITLVLHETSANGMLDVLSHLLNVDIQRTGRQVTLVPRATP